MHIAIDITPTQSGHKTRGVGSYTRLLVEALQKIKSDHSFYFFTRGKKLPKNVDLVHYPYFDPFFLTLPIIQPLPYVVTVHDLIPLAYPDKFPRGIRGEMKWQVQRLSLVRSKAIITDSYASKHDIARFTGISSDHIYPVHLAPAAHFHKVTDASLLKKISVKYALPKKFILYVGDVNWNKNVPGLLEAFALIKSTEFKDLGLVFVGKAFSETDVPEVQHINQKIRELHIGNSVVKLGFVPDNDLATIYSLAALYVQPSFAEGFGLPILEAMACGCPVVASDASSLSEISGPAIKVNPSDPLDMSGGIRQILQHKNIRALSKKGIAWAEKFSWEKVANQTITIYEKILTRAYI